MFARLWHAAMAGSCLAFFVTLAGAWLLALLMPERPLTRDDMPHLFLASWVLVTLTFATLSRSALAMWRAALLALVVLGFVAGAGAFVGAASAGVSIASAVVAALAIALWRALGSKAGPAGVRPVRNF